MGSAGTCTVRLSKNESVFARLGTSKRMSASDVNFNGTQHINSALCRYTFEKVQRNKK